MLSHSSRSRASSLIGLTALYVLIYAGAGFMAKEWTFLSSMLVPVIMMLCIYSSHKRLNYPAPLLWLLSCWGLLHLTSTFPAFPAFIPTSEAVPTLSSHWFFHPELSFRIILHIYGFFLLTCLVWKTLGMVIHQRFQRRLLPTFGLVSISATSALGFGAASDMLHILASRAFTDFPSTSIHDYGLVLLANFTGSVLACIFIKLRHL